MGGNPSRHRPGTLAVVARRAGVLCERTGLRSEIQQMTPGTAVTFVERRPDGTVSAITKTRTSGHVDTVRKNDGSTHQCVPLACGRFAPLSKLLIGHDHTVAKASPTPSPARKTTAQRTAKPVQSPAKPVQSGPKPVESAGPACNVLAVDFLNLLVRAWHVGKPTRTHAVKSFFQTLANAIRATKPAHVVIALDGGHKRRTELLPEYKAHRPPSDPGLTEQKRMAERALQLAGFQCHREPDWEADDVLASIATAYSDTVIVSSDKDLLAMHGRGRCRIYHPWGTGEFVTPDSKLDLPAGQVTDYLALCGDSSDGIPGVKGIGPKTAHKLLQEYGDLETILTMAHLQRIPGANGVRLREQKEAAILCRTVVELNTSLPVALTPFAPHAGWQQRLTDHGLGTCVAAVESLTGSRFMIASPAQTEVYTKEEVPECHAHEGGTGAKERESVATCEPQAPESIDPHSGVKARSGPPGITAEAQSATAADVEPAGRTDNLFRSASEPIRTGLTLDQIWSGPDRGLIGCWEAGRKCRQQGSENPFRRDTINHKAWQQGYDGLDLLITEAPATQHRPKGTLF